MFVSLLMQQGNVNGKDATDSCEIVFGHIATVFYVLFYASYYAVYWCIDDYIFD